MDLVMYVAARSGRPLALVVPADAPGAPHAEAGGAVLLHDFVPARGHARARVGVPQHGGDRAAPREGDGGGDVRARAMAASVITHSLLLMNGHAPSKTISKKVAAKKAVKQSTLARTPRRARTTPSSTRA